MTACRVALHTPRFWPFVGGPATATQLLAEGFAAAGDAVTVVTTRHPHSRPTQFAWDKIQVVALPQAGTRRWARFRYLLAWGRWLKGQRGRLNALVTAGSRYETYLALRTLRSPTLLVARAESWLTETPARWWTVDPVNRRIMRRSCPGAAGESGLRATRPCNVTPQLVIVAESEAQRTRFLHNGWPAASVVLIPPGIPRAAERTAARVVAARQALASANSDLMIHCTSPVGLVLEPLTLPSGCDPLIDAWYEIQRRFPDARLWIIGDGPEYRKLRRRVEQHGLQGRVILPGVFEELSELLYAVDFCVDLGSNVAIPWGILQAMAHALPVIARDTPTNRQILPSELHRFLVPHSTADGWSQAILNLLAQPGCWRTLGQRAREKAAADFSYEQMIDSYRRLWLQTTNMSATVNVEPPVTTARRT